jgi:hypothetical protein
VKVWIKKENELQCKQERRIEKRITKEQSESIYNKRERERTFLEH